MLFLQPEFLKYRIRISEQKKGLLVELEGLFFSVYRYCPNRFLAQVL